MAKYHQGFFRPKFPEKYKGDPTQIVYRSSWELSAMIKLDREQEVIQWSSEELVIPYRCKTDGKIHRYFTDFWVKMKFTDGTIKEYIIEIKPKVQTLPPKKPAKINKRYLNEVMTYAKNDSKWEAAKDFCKRRGMEFQILTEVELGVK